VDKVKTIKDTNGKKIKVGDILQSEWNYKVVASFKKEWGWYGKLVCAENHSCANIPYHLNGGKGHTIVKKQRKQRASKRHN